MSAQPSATAFCQPDRTADVCIAVVLAALTLIIALYFAPRGFHSGFVDMGHDGYQLRQVLDLTGGGVVFKDTFDQYGPLDGYLNAAGFMAFGRRLLAMKYFICGWYAVTVVLLYVMARQWLRPPLAALAGAAWLGLAPFYNHGIMISPHAYALLFQALATLIVLRSERRGPIAFALVGVLAGLCWAVKQSMGVFYLAAILSFLFVEWLVGRETWRHAAQGMAALMLTFSAIVGGFLLLLWAQGALPDWYLQTIAFPRAFYIPAAVAGAGSAVPGPISRLFNQAALFVEPQLKQPFYWLVLRGVVLLAALVQLLRRKPGDDALLMASITAFLWLGAYPSANFMHQWWTASLTFAPFVVCVRRLLARRITREATASWATAAVVLAVVLPGVSVRVSASGDRSRTLTETISEPPLYRGIRVEKSIGRAFGMLYETMSAYRADHPGTAVVSIETADGWARGMVESLPLLTFFTDNPHRQPVYWSLPVLTTTVYPRYGERLWRQIREDRPLLVDHRNGKFRPYAIAGYRTLAVAQSDYGNWYLYAPAAVEPVGDDRAVYLAADGSREAIVPDEDEVPQIPWRPNLDASGARRGQVPPSDSHEETVELAGAYPLTVVDPELRKTHAPVNVYTWPSDLPHVDLTAPLTPVSTDVVWRAGKGDIVRAFEPGAWTVDGKAPLPFAYLLQWRDEPLAAGTRLLVRGEVFEGGLQVGFLEHEQWYAFVCIADRGPFEAVVEIQKPGRYGLVAANCIRSSWSERAWANPIASMAGLLTGGYWPNRLHVSQAGWVAADGIR